MPRLLIWRMYVVFRCNKISFFIPHVFLLGFSKKNVRRRNPNVRQKNSKALSFCNIAFDVLLTMSILQYVMVKSYKYSVFFTSIRVVSVKWTYLRFRNFIGIQKYVFWNFSRFFYIDNVQLSKEKYTLICWHTLFSVLWKS